MELARASENVEWRMAGGQFAKGGGRVPPKAGDESPADTIKSAYETKVWPKGLGSPMWERTDEAVAYSARNHALGRKQKLLKAAALIEADRRKLDVRPIS